MTPNERRLRLDVAAARYLEAIERDDFDTLAALWTDAAADEELAAVLREVHAGLVEEQETAAAVEERDALTAAAARHLPSGTIVRPATGPITVADVADELFRRPPDRLPATVHQLNDRLRAAHEPLPPDLGLSKLTTWAEAKFGTAPEEYWKAFRRAALKLELRRAAEAEYHLAARPAPEPGDRP